MPGSLDKFKEGLMVDPDKEVGENHAALLKFVKGLVEKSRKVMGHNYTAWDKHDEVFRSTVKVSKEDENAIRKGQPAKMVVPLTYSQIMSFVAFSVMNVTQNKRFFELEYEGNKSPYIKEPLELILDRDCRRNGWNSFLVQFFLDVARFYIGCAEVCYTEQFRHMRVEQEKQVQGAFGNEATQRTSGFQKIPYFIGNKVCPISPYRFFPDTDLPLTRFQEGRYCGSEDMFNISVLRDDPAYFNLDCIPKMSEKQYFERRKNSRIDDLEVGKSRQKSDGSMLEGSDECVKDGAIVLTKVVVDITPKYFKVNEKQALGDEDFPVRYICHYANDTRIVRFEEATYFHGQFPYICAQYLPDQHKTVNEGLSSVCEQIGELITWKLNAHLASQKSSLDSRFVVDPAGIDMKSLESRNPYIMLKKGASQSGVDRYIKQLQVTDATAGVMGDIAALKDLLENVTGVSAQMQGSYSQGRRSATQDRVVAQGASARAKTTIASIWSDAFASLGRQLIINNRQEMDMETFVAIVGKGPFGPMQNVPVEQLYAEFRSDPITLARSEEYFVFDGTIPSEKAFLAQSLQEIFMSIMSNPNMLPLLGYGPEQVRMLFDEIYELRGVTPPLIPVAMPQQIPLVDGGVPPTAPIGQPLLQNGPGTQAA